MIFSKLLSKLEKFIKVGYDLMIHFYNIYHDYHKYHDIFLDLC